MLVSSVTTMYVEHGSVINQQQNHLTSRLSNSHQVGRVGKLLRPMDVKWTQFGPSKSAIKKHQDLVSDLQPTVKGLSKSCKVIYFNEPVKPNWWNYTSKHFDDIKLKGQRNRSNCFKGWQF